MIRIKEAVLRASERIVVLPFSCQMLLPSLSRMEQLAFCLARCFEEASTLQRPLKEAGPTEVAVHVEVRAPSSGPGKLARATNPTRSYPIATNACSISSPEFTLSPLSADSSVMSTWPKAPRQIRRIARRTLHAWKWQETARYDEPDLRVTEQPPPLARDRLLPEADFSEQLHSPSDGLRSLRLARALPSALLSRVLSLELRRSMTYA